MRARPRRADPARRTATPGAPGWADPPPGMGIRGERGDTAGSLPGYSGDSAYRGRFRDTRATSDYSGGSGHAEATRRSSWPRRSTADGSSPAPAYDSAPPVPGQPGTGYQRPATDSEHTARARDGRPRTARPEPADGWARIAAAGATPGGWPPPGTGETADRGGRPGTGAGPAPAPGRAGTAGRREARRTAGNARAAARPGGPAEAARPRPGAAATPGGRPPNPGRRAPRPGGRGQTGRHDQPRPGWPGADPESPSAASGWPSTDTGPQSASPGWPATNTGPQSASPGWPTAGTGTASPETRQTGSARTGSHAAPQRPAGDDGGMGAWSPAASPATSSWSPAAKSPAEHLEPGRSPGSSRSPRPSGPSGARR